MRYSYKENTTREGLKHITAHIVCFRNTRGHHATEVSHENIYIYDGCEMWRLNSFQLQ